MFHIALHQTEGPIRSILHLLGLGLAVPDHSTVNRRAGSLEFPRRHRGREAVHLLVDRTGLRLCGPGEWLLEKHRTRCRRSWRKLHLATDSDTGWIVATELTGHDDGDGGQVGPLLDGIDGPVACLTGDGAYDQNDVYTEIARRHPDMSIVGPTRSSAVPSAMAKTSPTQWDRHLQTITECGRMGWQRASGYNWRALVETDVSRWKRVIGPGLRSRMDGRQETEVAIAAEVLNRMLDPRRPTYARIT